MTSVLMTADAVGGVWTYALELVDALAAYDVEVHLAVMGPGPTDAQRRQASRSALRSMQVREFALEWMDDPWADVDAAAEWLLSLERELGPDVVHLNGYAHATLPWHAPTVVVAHSDVVSWWRAVHASAPPEGLGTYSARVRDGLAAADAVVAPTAAVLADLGRSFGFRGGVVIANGRRSDWVGRAHGRPKDPVIAAAGREWDHAKNLALLRQVQGRLSWPTVVASGQLAWDDVAELLLRASVFVAPARYEPFGLAALEAALAGCALVLGDIPSLHEVWGDAAVYVDPGDADGLSVAVQRLCDQPAVLAEKREQASQRARRYTPDVMAAGYARLYRRLPVKAVPA